jgi:transcriptional regulator with XRE-family HTH domain
MPGFEVLPPQTRALFGQSSEAIRLLDLVFNDDVLLRLQRVRGLLFGASWKPSQRKRIMVQIGDTFTLRALARRIRAARVAHGWTQQELADRSGIDRPNIARLEAAKHMPRVDTVAMLAEILSLPLSQLLETSISASQMRLRNEELLKVGVHRVKKTLRDMQEKTIVDEKGRRVRKELPREMLEGTSEAI